MLNLELQSGATEYDEPQKRGPLKKKEARHTFAPELIYAPPTAAAIVGGILVIFFILFLVHICGIGISFNNWPKTLSGKFHAFIFVV